MRIAAGALRRSERLPVLVGYNRVPREVTVKSAGLSKRGTHSVQWAGGTSGHMQF
jgi:hypothetical protein